MADLDATPLHGLHLSLGARMVPFAGYEMPVQFPAGVMAEHLHTRAAAGLFDVSHMGQVRLSGPDWDSVAQGFEALVPQDVAGLADGRQRYGFFTNDAGGIEDDLMFARQGNDLLVVVNAACRDADLARMRTGLPDAVTVRHLADRALLALQGPKAEDVLAAFDPAARDMAFMDLADLTLNGIAARVTRSGYTGEDGYEISVLADTAQPLAEMLLEHADVLPIGLGARNSLRLEAGLCLYGSDIDAGTTPVEAALGWAIQKTRRPGGDRAGGYPGARVVAEQLATGAARKRVGLRPETRAPMRDGVPLFAGEAGGAAVGQITSGTFGPSAQGPVAMGYVPAELSDTGTTLYGELRGKRIAVTVAPLPLVAARFKR
jgi:aminomethyltransferase